MTTLIEYLKDSANLCNRGHKPSVYQFVLNHGQLFKAPITPRPPGMRKGPNRHCFSNAYHLAEYTGGTYIEGFAIPPDIPLAILHAWVVSPEGRVIDPTWRTAGTDYFGIPFKRDYCQQVALTTGRYGILGNLRWRDFANHRPEQFRETL